MTEIEPQRDKYQALIELQAVTIPGTEADDALEGFVNLYDHVRSGEYKRNEEDEKYYTAFVANFENQCEANDDLKAILEEVESHLFDDE